MLREAAASGHLPLVKELLKFVGGVESTNARSSKHQRRHYLTALHAAAGAGHPAVVKVLIDAKASLTAVTPSHSSSSHLATLGTSTGHADCLQLLLEANAPLTVRDGNKQTLFHTAARAGSVACLRVLCRFSNQRMDQGPSMIDVRDRWHRTPVHWAVLNRQTDSLRVLIEELGANPSPPLIKEQSHKRRTHLVQETPRMIAGRLGADAEVLRLLVPGE